MRHEKRRRLSRKLVRGGSVDPDKVIVYSAVRNNETRFALHHFDDQKGHYDDADNSPHGFRIVWVPLGDLAFVSCRGRDFPDEARTDEGEAYRAECVPRPSMSGDGWLRWLLKGETEINSKFEREQRGPRRGRRGQAP
jgi:hypothetical protein